MERGAAGRTSEIAGGARDVRKKRWRDSALLGHERDQPRIGLMRGKSANTCSRDTAAFFERSNDLVHARDGYAGKCFAIELQCEPAIEIIAYRNRIGVFSGAAEHKFAERIVSRFVAVRSPHEKGARAVAKQAPEFAGYAAWSERAAMHIGGNDERLLRASGSEYGLRDRQSVQQSEAGASDIERAAIFAHLQCGMQLRGQRRIVVVCFTAGDDPVNFVSVRSRVLQSFLRCGCAERKLILAGCHVGQTFNSGAAAKFSNRHAERAIHIFRGDGARTQGMARAADACRRNHRGGDRLFVGEWPRHRGFLNFAENVERKCAPFHFSRKGERFSKKICWRKPMLHG